MSKSADTIAAKTMIDWLWRRPRTGRHRRRGAVRVIEPTFVATIAVLACLGVGELGVRVALHAPLLEWRDFRHDRAAATINEAVEYDNVLGWRLKPFLVGDGLNTLEYGIRSNGGPNRHVRPGGVLAIGSSFTVGSGVVDSETWPAQLAQLTGLNVNNAGQGGYQADQIILLGEQLLPLIRPRVLVVDLIPGTIIGTGYASSGWPKPYFTIEDGNLVAHNSPVPRSEAPRGSGLDVRRFFGHFAAVNSFMSAFFADFWFTSDGNSFVTVATDEIGVTCRLLDGLKQKADGVGVDLLLYLQYGALEIVAGTRMAKGGRFFEFQQRIKDKLKPLIMNTPPSAPSWYDASKGVRECARALGIATVDEFDTLRRAYETNADGLRTYYQTEPNGAMGHKSTFGNKEVARLVAAAMSELDLLPDQKSKQLAK